LARDEVGDDVSAWRRLIARVVATILRPLLPLLLLLSARRLKSVADTLGAVFLDMSDPGSGINTGEEA
jgi:hypothetical protein